MLKAYFFHIFFLMVLWALPAQIPQGNAFTLKGSVKEKANRAPIANVNVYINGGSFTKTNQEGEFTLKAQIGDELIVESPGFETVRYYIVNEEDILVLVEDIDRSEIARQPAKNELHKTYLDSANYFKKTNIDKSLAFIEKSLGVLGKNGNKEKTALSFSTLGDINFYYKQYDLAIGNYKTAIATNPSNDAKIKLGKAHLQAKQFKKAQEVFMPLTRVKPLSTYQKIEVFEGLADAYVGLSNPKEAIVNYEKALKIASDNKVTPKITDLNSKIAEVYSAEKNITKAEEFYGNSINLAEKQNAKRAVQEKEKAADFYNRSNLYDKEIDLRKSNLKEVEAMEGQAVSKSPGFLEADSITPQKINYKIANAYIAQQNLDKAIPYLKKSIDQAEAKEDLIVQKDATRKLSEVYRSVGDYPKALESYQNYVTLVDKLYVKKEQEISQATRFSRDIAQKQSRITSLEKDRELAESKYQLAVTNSRLAEESNKRQQIIIYALIFGLAMMGLLAYLLYRNTQQQKLANNLLALKQLRSQMNPHFIFNALNSVNNFIAKSDELNANRYLTEFSMLMRTVLENSEEDFIPLEKEIELLQLYTKLEHSRFTEKFDFEITIDNAVKVDEFQIPPMLLQPYVENAIWHGLRYKEEKGFLKVHFGQPSAETIRITIEDNGIGRKKSQELKTANQKKQNSKGMGNIKKRIAILNQMYKGKVDVFVEDAFEDGTGTRVVLTLNKD